MRRISPAEFVLAHTHVRRPPFVPEVRLHLADDSVALWEETQVAVDRGQVPPPFWAFVWAGGQAVARHLLDHPESVAERDVVDIATGSGLVAIAAMLAGAANVRATDIDELAVAAHPAQRGAQRSGDRRRGSRRPRSDGQSAHPGDRR